MDLINGLNNCNICNKKYSSYKSLWNHNKKFHNNKVTLGSHLGSHLGSQLKCKYCNNEFQNRSNRWRHEKTCKNNITGIIEINELKKEIIELKI